MRKSLIAVTAITLLLTACTSTGNAGSSSSVTSAGQRVTGSVGNGTSGSGFASITSDPGLTEPSAPAQISSNGSTIHETQATGPTTTPLDPADAALAAQVMAVVNAARSTLHLRTVLVAVSINGRQIVKSAVGESMTGVPATTDMHFRNGAVAESYMSMLVLELVDEKKIGLDDKVSKWLPTLPHASEVTLRQLLQMTSGYVDFEQLPNFTVANYKAPFKHWTPQELLSYAVGMPLWYKPGTNWNYAHTNYVVLGLALEKITGLPLATALQRKVLGPLGLTNTTDPGNATITEPALHAYSSERREQLKVPADVPFYEESTYWDPSWTFAQGAIETTDLDDLLATASAVGTGKLLSEESHAEMVAPTLRGKTKPVSGCAACFVQNEAYTYGLGVVLSGDWLLQDPLFSGESAVEAYLPSQKISLALAVTYEPGSFNPNTGSYLNSADKLWRQIAAKVAPSDAPPLL